MMLAFGVMAALYERGQSGKGQVIDAAMTDGSALLMNSIYGLMGQGCGIISVAATCSMAVRTFMYLRN